MTKPEIIEKLQEMNVEFDESASKKELEELLSKAEQGVPQEEEKLESQPIEETIEESEEKDNNEFGAGKVFEPAKL